MSRIGKQPISVPSGVKVAVSGMKVQVEGPKGKLEVGFRPEVTVAVDGGAVKAARGIAILAAEQARIVHANILAGHAAARIALGWILFPGHA